jgi:predicted KAP-like P-loop ATPase
MWPDNETDKDFLNFSSTADTVASIIRQANGRPISIGVSGQWGIGKSSMIKLIQASLRLDTKTKATSEKYIFVEFNAWLYQGYDDARAALLDVIADTLEKEAEKRQKGVDKAKDFLKRVNWLRVAKTGLHALPLLFGLPPVGLMGEAFELMKKIGSGGIQGITQAEIDKAGALADKGLGQMGGLLKDKQEDSPPKEIQGLRNSFEETLGELGVTLVVLIDDLDRCLPQTTISTLEAIRLLLFLKNTAFVIAADDKMIKHAVKKHFEGIEDDLVTNYFDKLIQIPIKVPALGNQEVRAYMMLLFMENSALGEDVKEEIRKKVCTQLSLSWKGERVDYDFITQLKNVQYPSELVARFQTAERLAHIMTTSKKINGNPRIIKRFLNALSIRLAIANSLGVGVDEAVLAKLLLFERCGSEKGYQDLIRAVNEDHEGKPHFLKSYEAGEKSKHSNLDPSWEDEFIREWISIPPALSDKDLRGALYVGKEHLPLVTAEDRLSPEAMDLVKAILTNPSMARSLKDRISKLQKTELSIIMDKILDKARQEQEWGTPDILEACLVISEKDQQSASKFKNFLIGIPATQIKAGLIPKISDQPWAPEIFGVWKNAAGISTQVKSSIKNI